MSIAAPMLVISLIIYAGLFGLFIYLVILIIRALKKYIRSKDVRAEKSVLISVATRMQFGSDIGAGCGQLYADERD